jgi:hypothetical protein
LISLPWVRMTGLPGLGMARGQWPDANAGGEGRQHERHRARASATFHRASLAARRQASIRCACPASFSASAKAARLR